MVPELTVRVKILLSTDKMNTHIFRHWVWRANHCTSLCLPLHQLPCGPPEVYPVGLVILALSLDLHPETGLVVQVPDGVLNAVEGQGFGAEGQHPGPPAEGSWWSATWTRACAPEVSRTGLQSQEQTGPLGWAWLIWWWGAGPREGRSTLSLGAPSEGGRLVLGQLVWS